MTIEILPLGRLLLRLLHAACGPGCRLAILPFLQFLQILHTGGTPFKVGSMVLTAVSTLYLLFRHRVVVSFRREITVNRAMEFTTFYAFCLQIAVPHTVPVLLASEALYRIILLPSVEAPENDNVEQRFGFLERL